MLQSWGHNPALFEEENYQDAKYGLVREVRIDQKFFPILLIILKGGVDCNQDADLEDLQEYLANFKADEVDCHKTNEQIEPKLQSHL